MTGAALEVCDLVVVRGGTRAVDGVSFRTAPGQVVGLLGPSGCGKSSLLRALVGVQLVTGGAVTVFGEPAGGRALRSRVGYLTQAPSVYGDLTVLENLRFFGAVLGVDPAEVRRCLEAVDLTAHADRIVQTLSGGEGGRASLAVALLGDPDLLVLDEPTVGLDPLLRRELWSLFHGVAARGKAVIVSSHVMDEAVRCDRLLLMRQGRLLADDTVDGLLARTGTDDVELAFLALVEEAP